MLDDGSLIAASRYPTLESPWKVLQGSRELSGLDVAGSYLKRKLIITHDNPGDMTVLFSDMFSFREQESIAQYDALLQDSVELGKTCKKLEARILAHVASRVEK